MSLRAALAAPAIRQGRCGIADILARLDNVDAEVLERALVLDSGFSHVQIHAALRGEGHQAGKDMVGRHRRGECACGRAS